MSPKKCLVIGCSYLDRFRTGELDENEPLSHRKIGRPVKSRSSTPLLVVVAVLLTSTLAACGSPSTTSSVPTQRPSPSQKDYGTLVAACLRAEGWDAKATPGDAFTVKLHGKASALEKDAATCRSELGFVDRGKPSAQEVSNYYAAQLKVRTCLIDQGFTIATPPSKQTFMDTFDSAKGWNPYGSIGQVSTTEWNHLNTVCPQARSSSSLPDRSQAGERCLS